MTRTGLTFQSRSIILRIILYSLLYFFREDYSQHINIKSNLKRVSTFLLIFHVVFSDSSYSLLLRRLLLPKTFFSCLYFSLIPFSTQLVLYSSLVDIFRNGWKCSPSSSWASGKQFTKVTFALRENSVPISNHELLEIFCASKIFLSG